MVQNAMPARKVGSTRGRKSLSKKKSASAKRKATKKKAPAKRKKVVKKKPSARARPAKKVKKSKAVARKKKPARRKKSKKTAKSLGKPLYLLSVEVENVRCFGPAQTLQLSDERGKPYGWTVIFGDNGAGKTTLLQAVCGIASTLQDHKEVPSFIRYNWWPQRKPTKPALVRSNALLRPREVAEFSVRYSPARRRQSPPPRWDFNRDGTLIYFGYGASRRHGQAADSGRKPLESSADESLFVDDAELLNAEEWFVQMSHLGPARRQLREARAAKKVRDLLNAVLLDVNDIRIASNRGRGGVRDSLRLGLLGRPQHGLSDADCLDRGLRPPTICVEPAQRRSPRRARRRLRRRDRSSSASEVATQLDEGSHRGISEDTVHLHGAQPHGLAGGPAGRQPRIVAAPRGSRRDPQQRCRATRGGALAVVFVENPDVELHRGSMESKAQIAG